jgi:hypothetical protein
MNNQNEFPRTMVGGRGVRNYGNDFSWVAVRRQKHTLKVKEQQWQMNLYVIPQKYETSSAR